MTSSELLPGLKGKTCVITGGGGIIGRALSEGLAASGMSVVVLDLDVTAARSLAQSLADQYHTKSLGLEANVLDRASLLAAKISINDQFGPIDFLINCAGGNSPKATTRKETVVTGDSGDLSGTFFGLDLEGFRKVFDLNFLGTILPTMVFVPDMVAHGGGAVLNISSMNAFRPLTKIPAYSAAKASINNFTEWLAVHLAPSHIRVNGIAPGFLSTQQNKFLLYDAETGKLSERGLKIIAATPMGRFGEPEELQGAMLFLLSDAAKFITGVVLPVDGGFNAYAGV